MSRVFVVVVWSRTLEWFDEASTAVVSLAIRRVWRRRRGEVRRDMSERQSPLKRNSKIHCSAVIFAATSRSWASFGLESMGKDEYGKMVKDELS